MRRTSGKFATIYGVPVILDLGHWKLKAICGDDQSRHKSEPHALIELPRDEWHSVVSAGHEQNPDYIQVGNRYFEVGETAASHTANIAEGVARYTRNYYGVQMCHMIAGMLEPHEIREAVVFASYPPGDRRHKDTLEEALLGKWEFHHTGRRYEVSVRRVVTYTEPMGGFWNFVLQEDEDGYFDNPDYLKDRPTLVIDLGGGTMSMQPIGVDQRPDYRRAESFPSGFNDVARRFQRELRVSQRDLLNGTRQIPTALLHESLRDGLFRGAGNIDGIDVRREVETALSELLDDFRLAFQTVGGAAPYGQIILTGGGNIVLGERIKMLTGHQRVFYANADIGDLVYANVKGGFKAFRVLTDEGVI